jgi:hypothetical protein
MCVRSQACRNAEWLSQTRAVQHRRVNCCPLNSVFAYNDVLDAHQGAYVLPPDKCTRGGIRNMNVQQQLVPGPVHVEHAASPGFERHLLPQLDEGHQSENQGAEERAAGSGGDHFTAEHEHGSLEVSADHPHLIPPCWDDTSDDEERHVGPLVDNWPMEPLDPAESEHSGGSIDLLQAELNSDHAQADSDKDNDGSQHVGPVEEPDYELLQKRLVAHMTEYCLPAREARRAKRATGWAQAADKRVSNHKGAVRVRDYGFDKLYMYRTDVQSRKSLEEHLLSNAYGLLEDATAPDPAGIQNCLPPTVAAAMAVLGVPLLEWYEVHFCRNGCMHFWFHMPRLVEHYKQCSLKIGCSECVCPHCGACRFVKGKKGIHGAERCWFFFDCLHNKALDPEWASVVLNTQAARDDPNSACTKPSFAQQPAPEYERVIQHLSESTKLERARTLVFTAIRYVLLCGPKETLKLLGYVYRCCLAIHLLTHASS